MAEHPLTAGTKNAEAKKFCFTVDDNIRFLKELSEGIYVILI